MFEVYMGGGNLKIVESNKNEYRTQKSFWDRVHGVLRGKKVSIVAHSKSQRKQKQITQWCCLKF